jgi:phosphohistidine swiveling domain-containing protein
MIAEMPEMYTHFLLDCSAPTAVIMTGQSVDADIAGTLHAAAILGIVDASYTNEPCVLKLRTDVPVVLARGDTVTLYGNGTYLVSGTVTGLGIKKEVQNSP